MRQRPIVGSAVLAVAILIAPMAGAEDLEFRPASAADLAVAMDDSRAPLAATSLAAEASCGQSLPRAAIVDLAWGAAGASGASARRVDISKFPEGFATGRFDTTGVQAASLRAASVQAPEPGLRYYWRVLTRGPEGWVSSQVRRFRVPVCRADVLEPDQAAGYRLNDDAATTPDGEEG